MKNVLVFIRNKINFLGAVVIAAIVGGATTAVVMAAIPDSGGVIHGCYKNSTGMVKVVDTTTGGTCASGETSLNWNQTGPQGPQGPAGSNEPVAFGEVVCDSASNSCSLDLSNSSGITSYQSVNAGSDGYWECVTVNSTPHAIIYGFAKTFRDSSGNWYHASDSDVQYDGQCDGVSGSNVALQGSIGGDLNSPFVIY